MAAASGDDGATARLAWRRHTALHRVSHAAARRGTRVRRRGRATAARRLQRAARMLPALHVHLVRVHVVFSTYALAMAVAVAAAVAIGLRRARRPDVVLAASALAVVAGIVGAEAWHRVAHGNAGLS